MKRRPRVLMLVPLPPPIHGASLMSRQLVQSTLLQRHFRLRVIPLRFTAEMSRLAKFSPAKLARGFWFSLRLLAEITCFRPSLVYAGITARGYSHYRDFTWVILMRLFRVKRLFHVRERGFSPTDGRCARLRYRTLFAGSHAIVLSPLLKSDISPWVARDNLHVVPNGFPDQPPQPRSESSEKPPLLLFLSNLMVNKGVYVLLEAAARLRDRGLKFNLALAGAFGQDIRRGELEARIRELDLTERVKVNGPVDEIAKSALLRQASMLIFPTMKEAFGNVLLEAMRAEVPVVATREGSIPWIVSEGKTGLLCNKNDPGDLAAKVEHLLLDSGLLVRMGKAGRQRFLEHFTLNRYETCMLRTMRLAMGEDAC